MTIELSLVEKFSAVYAEAILTLLDSGEDQWVLWDGHSHRFDFTSTELDEPELPILLTVNANWEKQVGDVGEVTDPDAEHYDVEALRAAIEHTLINEGAGERILKEFVERLEGGDEDEEENEEEDDDERDDEDERD